jgi:hypothetical protein
VRHVFAVFVVYLVVIFVGIVVYTIVGVTHN